MEANRTATAEKNRLSAEHVAATNFGQCCRANPDPSSVSGLFLDPLGNIPGLEFIPLCNAKNPIDNVPNLSGIKILNSCHGLLCCLGYNHGERKSCYHVLNPTTKQFSMLPEPHAGVDGLSLAFDPWRSPDHYKVVCVWSYSKVYSIKPQQSETHYHFEIYSSDTLAPGWRASAETISFRTYYVMSLEGVYWNGAVHWWSEFGDGLYLDVERDRLAAMPMPPVPEGKEYYDRSCRHQLVSREHLHIIDIYNSAQFNVFEMERDYSGWYVKYRVDLGTTIGASFPRMMEIIQGSGEVHKAYAVLSLVREEDEEKSFLVVNVPGKVIRYNLFYQTFDAVLDVEATSTDENDVRFSSLFHVYHYIESFARV